MRIIKKNKLRAFIYFLIIAFCVLILYITIYVCVISIAENQLDIPIAVITVLLFLILLFCLKEFISIIALPKIMMKVLPDKILIYKRKNEIEIPFDEIKDVNITGWFAKHFNYKHGKLVIVTDKITYELKNIAKMGSTYIIISTARYDYNRKTKDEKNFFGIEALRNLK